MSETTPNNPPVAAPMSVTLAQQIESLLFVNQRPFSSKQLAKFLEKPLTDVQQAIDELIKKYDTGNGGIVVQRIEDKIQLATAAPTSGTVQKWVKQEQNKELTRPSLETLTIVAYRGPVAKAEIEMIRGINCSLILRNLMIRGLVEMLPGKDEHDTKYQISFEFMRWLGLKEAKELPEFAQLNSNEYLQELLQKPNNPNA